MPLRGPGSGKNLVVITPMRWWGHVSVVKVPPSYPSLDGIWDPRRLKEFSRAREAWSMEASANTFTEFGKDYLIRFVTRATSRALTGAFFATNTAEQDDYISWVAVGDGAVGPPDPTAFDSATDTIGGYRGRGRIVIAQDLDPDIYPNAVQLEGHFTGLDIVSPPVTTRAFTMNEAALVPFGSDDHLGDNPGNEVIAYCSFIGDETSVVGEDRVAIRWIAGIS